MHGGCRAVHVAGTNSQYSRSNESQQVGYDYRVQMSTRQRGCLSNRSLQLSTIPEIGDGQNDRCSDSFGRSQHLSPQCIQCHLVVIMLADVQGPRKIVSRPCMRFFGTPTPEIHEGFQIEDVRLLKSLEHIPSTQAQMKVNRWDMTTGSKCLPDKGVACPIGASNCQPSSAT
jgi:hypothetical protein